MSVPQFRYHPDPYATGVVVGADEVCESCEERRSLFYVGPFYAVERPERLCLWCVADGSAAAKFDGLFVDEANFDKAGIDEAIVEEVMKRTPSYRAWQQEQWLIHCNDACEFRGFPSLEEARSASDETIAEWSRRNDLEPGDWDTTVEGFASGGAGLYRFACRTCGLILFASDWS